MKNKNKAFIDKIKTLTFGTGAKFKPPAWVPKVVGPDGKEMKCVAAGKVSLSGLLVSEPPPPSRATGDNDDSFAA